MLRVVSEIRIERQDFIVILVVIENEFKQPLRQTEIGLHETPRAVSVTDTFDVAIRSAPAVALADQPEIDVVIVLFRVLVNDGIAAVVVSFGDQPAKDSLRLLGVGIDERENARVVSRAVKRGDVAARDGAPRSCAAIPPKPTRLHHVRADPLGGL